MKQKFTDDEKSMLVKKYADRESASMIFSENGVFKKHILFLD